MKIQMLAIGKPHEGYIKTGVEDFSKRITNYFPVEWVLISPLKNAATLSEKELKKKEGEAVLQVLKKEDILIALDERGKQLSSVGLAQMLQTKANESTKSLVFLIGGAFGIDEKVLARADFKWALSNLTFPHQLVRLILAEQLYRACSILRNEKYHHQ